MPDLNPLQCPLCGQPNQCAIAAGLPAEQCWCMTAHIAPEILEQLPKAQRNTACICPACGQKSVPSNATK